MRPEGRATTSIGLASYPISETFSGRVRDALDSELETLNVSSLRRLPPLQLLRTLRSHRGQPFALLVEDDSSEAILPVLILVAVGAGASRITVVHGDGSTAAVRGRDAVRATLSLGRATLSARLAARRAHSETATLSAEPRGRRRLSNASGAIYVNANLWFGLRAGGSVGHVAGVVNALLDSGLDVDVAAIAPQPLVRPDAGFIGLRPPRSLGFPPELNQYRFSQSVAAQLRQRDPTKYRFVYQRLSLGNYAGAQLARTWRIPLVLEYNGSEVWVARHWGRPLGNEPLARAAETASLRQADVVVTVSDVLGEELAERGVDPARTVVYPNGVDPSLFDPARVAGQAAALRAGLGIAPTATVVAFLGTFGKWHGTEILAHAIRALSTQERAWLERNDVHFLLVGDGLQMPLVRTIIGDGAAERVHLTGLVPQADAPAYLGAADAVVSPHVANQDGSRFFGSPTKLFEYMAMGLPIVASALDQIGDILQPSVRVPELSDIGEPLDSVALLTTPGSEQELAAGIRYLVDRPDWRAALGRNARKLALERHTWDAHVDAILARLNDVCG